MIVCIAEKPSVARDIAHVLGATASHEGYLEGNGYQVTWTFGHLCELKAPEDYSPAWKRWTLGQLPLIPARFGIRLKADRGIARQFAAQRFQSMARRYCASPSRETVMGLQSPVSSTKAGFPVICSSPELCAGQKSRLRMPLNSSIPAFPHMMYG